MEDNKEALIESIFANNKSGVKSRECYISKYFPNEYINIINHPINKINDIDWFRKLYNYINGLKEIPLCKVCGAQVNFINIRRGYNGCCSINCLNKSDDKKRKTKKTNLIKYGFENPGTNAQVKEKRNATNLIKYGDSNFNNNAEIREKINKTCIKKYGCINPSQFREFKDKRKNTFMERYGVDHYSKTKEFNEKCKKTNMERYGTNHYSSTDEGKNKIINTMIERYGEIWINFAPKYNANSIIYLDMLSEKLGIPIQHALNGGEKKFIRYWVDGYIEQYNICIEWDEKHHNGTKQREHDKNKENFIIKNFNSKIFRVNQKEFFKNIEVGINNITSLIINYIAMIGNLGG